MKYSLPKGTFDILPNEPKRQDQWKESHRWNYLESVMRELAHTYGYQEIRTPILKKQSFLFGVLAKLLISFRKKCTLFKTKQIDL